MSDTHDIQAEVKGYIIVFVSLLALTVITVTISYLKLNITAAIGVALFIAIVKASLVACYFMHLISERKLIYMILIFLIVFFLGVIMIPLYESVDVPQGTIHHVS